MPQIFEEMRSSFYFSIACAGVLWNERAPIAVLPPEILLEIFHLLRPGDLASAALVCSSWEKAMRALPLRLHLDEDQCERKIASAIEESSRSRVVANVELPLMPLGNGGESANLPFWSSLLSVGSSLTHLTMEISPYQALMLHSPHPDDIVFFPELRFLSLTCCFATARARTRRKLHARQLSLSRFNSPVLDTLILRGFTDLVPVDMPQVTHLEFRYCSCDFEGCHGMRGLGAFSAFPSLKTLIVESSRGDYLFDPPSQPLDSFPSGITQLAIRTNDYPLERLERLLQSLFLRLGHDDPIKSIEIPYISQSEEQLRPIMKHLTGETHMFVRPLYRDDAVSLSFEDLHDGVATLSIPADSMSTIHGVLEPRIIANIARVTVDDDAYGDFADVLQELLPLAHNLRELTIIVEDSTLGVLHQYDLNLPAAIFLPQLRTLTLRNEPEWTERKSSMLVSTVVRVITQEFVAPNISRININGMSLDGDRTVLSSLGIDVEVSFVPGHVD